MRDLVGMGFEEGGATSDAFDVGLGCWTRAMSANKGDAQHIRHEQVRDSKAICCEPLTLAQYPLNVGKPLVHPAN